MAGFTQHSRSITQKTFVMSLMCAVQALNKLNIPVSVEDMNDSIIVCKKSNEQYYMSACKTTEKDIPQYGQLNVGNIAECVFTRLVKIHAHCYLRKWHLTKSSVGRITDFVRVYRNNISQGIITTNSKIILIGWAGDGHYEMDDGITHYTCVFNECFIDNKTTTPVTEKNIAASYHGLHLTRLKVYHLEPFLAKTKRIKRTPRKNIRICK